MRAAQYFNFQHYNIASTFLSQWRLYGPSFSARIIGQVARSRLPSTSITRSYHVRSSIPSIPLKGLFTHEPRSSGEIAKKPPTFEEIEKQFRLYRSRMAYAGTLRLVILQQIGLQDKETTSVTAQKLWQSLKDKNENEVEDLFAEEYRFFEALDGAGEAALVCKRMCLEFLAENKEGNSRSQEARKLGKEDEANQEAETAFARVDLIRQAVLRPSRYYFVRTHWKQLLAGTMIGAVVLFYGIG